MWKPDDDMWLQVIKYRCSLSHDCCQLAERETLILDRFEWYCSRTMLRQTSLGPVARHNEAFLLFFSPFREKVDSLVFDDTKRIFNI